MLNIVDIENLLLMLKPRFEEEKRRGRRGLEVLNAIQAKDSLNLDAVIPHQIDLLAPCTSESVLSA